MSESPRRVLTVAPLPPEKVAYALARYSRSPDSISDSIEWVRTHDSSKFLDSFYFQYGHASIADLGHLVLCFEGISELAATEIEDEQLWDGQARSSRYQDFGRCGFIRPPDLAPDQAKRYDSTAESLLKAYRDIHAQIVGHLTEKLPRPDSMKPEAYGRNVAARAFDIARYCLFLGIPTGVGQVVSIRTLERQIQRMRASEYHELRDLGTETANACALPPSCGLEGSWREPLAPTLAKYVEAEQYRPAAMRDLQLWAEQNLGIRTKRTASRVELTIPESRLADIAATLLYAVTDWPFADLYSSIAEWSVERQREVLDVVLQSRTKRDDLLREFRGAPYSFDLLIDIGAYRDLHRHRRCHQVRQAYTTAHGFETPSGIEEAGLQGIYSAAITAALENARAVSGRQGDYLLPFATRSRFLFKMDFAEAEYITRLRTGVKGHFSYRQVAWEMMENLQKAEPGMANILQGTPPWVEDPLQR